MQGCQVKRISSSFVVTKVKTRRRGGGSFLTHPVEAKWKLESNILLGMGTAEL